LHSANTKTAFPPQDSIPTPKKHQTTNNDYAGKLWSVCFNSKYSETNDIAHLAGK